VDVLYKNLGDDNEKEDDDADQGDEEEEEAHMDENFILERNPPDAVVPDLQTTYKGLIDCVRAVVKYFMHEKKI